MHANDMPAVAAGQDQTDDHCFVVMAHGDSPFLEGCLASLRAQTLRGAIVITTSTPSVFIDSAAQDYGLRVLVNPHGGGIAADWNFALAATPARRVTLAHQDDVYRPRFLERSLALLDATDGVMCFTSYQEIDDDGRDTTSRVSKVTHLLEWATLGGETLITPRRMRAFLSMGDPLPCSSVTFDRQRLGDFAFSGDYDCNLDWDAWVRLFEQGHPCIRVPERLVGRRHNPLTATSRLIREGVRQREDLRMFRRLWPSPVAETIAFAYRASY
jgi:hypothetical protein